MARQATRSPKGRLVGTGEHVGHSDLGYDLRRERRLADLSGPAITWMKRRGSRRRRTSAAACGRTYSRVLTAMSKFTHSSE